MKRRLMIIVAVFGVLLLAGCGASHDAAVPQETTEQTRQPAITEISEEVVVMHDALLPMDDPEGEESDYYVKGSYEGQNVFWVTMAADERRFPVPISDTAIYLTDSGENYIEKVSFSYMTSDGERHNVEQYRITANRRTNAQPPLSVGG